jgi:AcrR family transcriptional regulator
MARAEGDGYHHGDLRAALREAAENLLQEIGTEGVTLRAVARAAGVSHAAPYRHFSSKEDLLAEVARAGFDQLRERLAAVRGEDSVRAAGAAYVRFALEQPAHFELMFGPYIKDFGRHPELARAAGLSFEELVEIIAAEQREGRVTAGSVEEHATFAWSAVHGLATLAIRRRMGPDVEGRIDIVTERVLSGIATGFREASAPAATPPGS